MHGGVVTASFININVVLKFVMSAYNRYLRCKDPAQWPTKASLVLERSCLIWYDVVCFWQAVMAQFGIANLSPLDIADGFKL